jgi:release factor glutamine methyltransferase
VTVLEAIQKSTEFLTKKGVESPRLQTELLLAHLLQMPRMKLYLNFERALSPAETDALRGLVKRRGQHEPLQHLTGSTSFCGLEIAVNRHALVPRPETELLAEAGWQFLSTLNLQPSTALDLGTGTGCIAVALAVKCPQAKIVATDVSADALALAMENTKCHGVAERIEFLEGDGFAALQSEGRVARAPESDVGIGDWQSSSLRKFDLIISNPPYIPSAEIATLQPEVRDFDPHTALDGGGEGLDFYRMFSVRADPFLKPGGRLMLEFGDGQAEAIRRIFEVEKWIVEEVREDYSHRARILIAKPSPSSPS